MSSNFSFIKDPILRSNIDHTFDQIIIITSIIENYSSEKVIQSNFRKIAIILTASIIEALLLYILKSNKKEDELSTVTTEIKILKKLYEINEIESVSHIKYAQKSNKIKFNKLNLGQLIKICIECKLISKDLKSKLEKIQKLRNKQHIGTLELIDTEYTEKELKFTFDLAKEIKILSQT